MADDLTAPGTSSSSSDRRSAAQTASELGTSASSHFTISIKVLSRSAAQRGGQDSSSDSDNSDGSSSDTAHSSGNDHPGDTSSTEQRVQIGSISHDPAPGIPTLPHTLVLDPSQQESLNLSFSTNSIPTTTGRSVFFLRSINQAGRSLYTNDYTIRENIPRLTHYIEEPNVGRGFIKELCFSQDGRLICSPFGFGIRLLAFDPGCRELCDCDPATPVQLHEVTSNMSHAREVVTCKFSPTHSLVVSGCLNGKVDFHQPVL